MQFSADGLGIAIEISRERQGTLVRRGDRVRLAAEVESDQEALGVSLSDVGQQVSRHGHWLVCAKS